MLTRAAYLLPHKRLVNGEQRIGNNLMNLLPKCIDIHAALFKCFMSDPMDHLCLYRCVFSSVL